MQAPVLLAWSGGKDAAWALHVLRRRGDVAVGALLSTVERDSGRTPIQGIRRELLQAQAAACGLPLIEMAVPASCGNDAYEAALAAALAQAAEQVAGMRTLAFGDLFLDDIRRWREAQCARLGWQARFPLFGNETARLARAMLAGGLDARLCCIDTRQLDARFAGRRFDARLLDDLPARTDPCGERGEFHTCVTGGPMFAAPVRVCEAGLRTVDGRFACVDLVPDADG